MTYKEFSNLVKQAAAQAGFSMPGDAGNALSPAPAAMPIKKQDPLAAAGAAPAEPEVPKDPITALSSSLDKITAVANKQVAQNAPPQPPQQPSIASQVPPMPAGDAIPKAANKQANYTGDSMNYLDVQRLRNEVAADMRKQAGRVEGVATRSMYPMGQGANTRGVEKKDIDPPKKKKDYSKAINVGKNVGIGAGIGALGGAVSGALSKKKEGESRAKKVLKHMAIGAGIGGAAGGVGGELADTDAAKAAIAWVKNRLAKKQPIVEAPGNVAPGPVTNKYIATPGRQVFPIGT